MWSVTCFDWKPTTAGRVESHAVRQISRRGWRPFQIILLHDGGHMAMGADRSASIEAADRLISRYHAQGMKFLKVPEMMVAEKDTAAGV